MSNITALYDACVLYPATLRDFLMSLAVMDLFRARWTERIHEEWIGNVLKNRPDLSRDQLARTRVLMNAAVLDCVISDYEDLIEALTLPDPNDRHVLAAAIHGRVDVIVTTNLKHFPVEVLSRYAIDAQHPDTFASHLLSLNSSEVCHAAHKHRLRLKNPSKTVEEYIDSLAQIGLVQTTDGLLAFRDLL